MAIRYYLGWFPQQLPQSLIEALHRDMKQTQSLVNTLSKRIPMYVSNQNCAVRVEGDAISILGTVYLIENEQMTLLPQTL